MPGDLHTHTTFSDGSTPADKLPFLAACAGMTHLAISDHDSIRSVRYAYAHPVQNGVHLIPATELDEQISQAGKELRARPSRASALLLARRLRRAGGLFRHDGRAPPDRHAAEL